MQYVYVREFKELDYKDTHIWVSFKQCVNPWKKEKDQQKKQRFWWTARTSNDCHDRGWHNHKFFRLWYHVGINSGEKRISCVVYFLFLPSGSGSKWWLPQGKKKKKKYVVVCFIRRAKCLQGQHKSLTIPVKCFASMELNSRSLTMVDQCVTAFIPDNSFLSFFSFFFHSRQFLSQQLELMWTPRGRC